MPQQNANTPERGPFDTGWVEFGTETGIRGVNAVWWPGRKLELIERNILTLTTGEGGRGEESTVAYSNSFVCNNLTTQDTAGIEG